MIMRLPAVRTMLLKCMVLILGLQASSLFSQINHDDAEQIPLFRSDLMTLLRQDEVAWYLPIAAPDRRSLANVQVTRIGPFGLLRAARPGIPAHLHTGVDLQRPHDNYVDEPIFPAAKGRVISLRDDGPYAQIIIRHRLADSTDLWTVYEHVAGIRVGLHESVDPQRPIARFMTRAELDRYGWQFDHVHFEVMRVKPKPRMPDQTKPFFHFGTYCLVCYTQADLDEKYYDPLQFLQRQWRERL
ncbi:peptidoglycan DD-metalloendopeptidase family protein [candidate division KSB1 bacterium]|nr:peptidoglycan DD-metalloendopeptidase family protein [candidate division KSB1 bacterium]